MIKDLKHHVRINIQDLEGIVSRSPEKHYDSYINRLEEHETEINEFFTYFDKMKREFRESVSYKNLTAQS
ncbi:MAG: hypothetical protein HC803_03035 [Saprospiraceae bacterium]|nr:hypothetical protein [Saprospiraceae bacterium]